MELPEFIRTHDEQILDQWEQVADNTRACPENSVKIGRTHASRRLHSLADELDADDPLHQSIDSSWHCDDHDLLQRSDMNAIFSLYQNLRSSVLTLWMNEHQDQEVHRTDLYALTHFNASIDRAVFQIVHQYSASCRKNEKLLDALLSISPDLNLLLDPMGKIMYGNHAFSRLIGKSSKDFVGKQLSEFNLIEGRHLQRDLLTCLQSKMNVRGEMSWPNPNSQETTYEYCFSPLVIDAGAVETIAVLAKDKTDRILAEEKCYKEANYDSLTGLPNRNLFRDRLATEVNRVERNGTAFALLFIDLDGFKEVNDGLGHAAGDQLLALTGQRIHSCVRNTDTVARLGGDEFTVIITEMSHISSVEFLARKILTELSRPFYIAQNDIKISGSMGITLCPHDGMNTDDLLRNADQAMYASKNAGRNRYNFFTLSMRDSAWARLKVIEQLRHALPLHQLIVLFQPVVDLRTSLIIKAEALLRWQHPEFGLMYPYEFVNLAEEIGAIGDIDAWVFNESLICAKKWSAIVGFDFQVSVNKSPQEFSQKIISSEWGIQLQNLQQASKYIAVEITENIFMHDSPIAKDRISDLQNSGIELIIDHFGVGHSLMAYLRKFEANYLKMDQSFVRDILTNENSQTMYETMVVMAHKLGLKAIATGVENVRQRDWLKAINCDMAQGYFISRPLQFDEFSELLRKNKEESLITKS